MRVFYYFLFFSVWETCFVCSFIFSLHRCCLRHLWMNKDIIWLQHIRTFHVRWWDALVLRSFLWCAKINGKNVTENLQSCHLQIPFIVWVLPLTQTAMTIFIDMFVHWLALNLSLDVWKHCSTLLKYHMGSYRPLENGLVTTGELQYKYKDGSSG